MSDQVYGSKIVGMRAAFSETIVEIGADNEKVVAIDAETALVTKIDEFKKAFPQRYITTGVAEQNAVSMAFGIARMGYIPVVPLLTAFLTRRAFDQIYVQVAYANANVKLVGCYAGFSTANTGATHQMIDDIALMRSLPNMAVIEAADASELRQAMKEMIRYRGPVFLRMIRSDLPEYEIDCCSGAFQIGKSRILEEGSDITLIGSGMMVSRCLEAAGELQKNGISAEVINLSSIKPIDADTIARSAEKTRKVVTAENHSVLGGVGSAVCEVLSERMPVPVKRVGVMDRFGESGAQADLLDKYGLTTRSVVAAARELLD